MGPRLAPGPAGIPPGLWSPARPCYAWRPIRGPSPPAHGSLVLTALVFAPVSRVAPAREIGILIGTILGGGLLAEGGLKRRLLASLCMVLGIVALAAG